MVNHCALVSSMTQKCVPTRANAKARRTERKKTKWYLSSYRMWGRNKNKMETENKNSGKLPIHISLSLTVAKAVTKEAATWTIHQQSASSLVNGTYVCKSIRVFGMAHIHRQNSWLKLSSLFSSIPKKNYKLPFSFCFIALLQWQKRQITDAHTHTHRVTHNMLVLVYGLSLHVLFCY